MYSPSRSQKRTFHFRLNRATEPGGGTSRNQAELQMTKLHSICNLKTSKSQNLHSHILTFIISKHSSCLRTLQYYFIVYVSIQSHPGWRLLYIYRMDNILSQIYCSVYNSHGPIFHIFNISNYFFVIFWNFFSCTNCDSFRINSVFLTHDLLVLMLFISPLWD